MTEVKALFPIGKTQWRKWTDAQRSMFNALCAQGKPVGAATKAVNEYKPEPPATDKEPPLAVMPPKAAKPRNKKA
jgi:hypothetical protein